MAYCKQDDNGTWLIYDTDCSGVVSGPYPTIESAQAAADELNAE